MEYNATGVAGAGTTFGTWAAVSFESVVGTFPSLIISNTVGAMVVYSIPAIGGGAVQPGSQADLEWAHFIAEVGGAFGLRAAEVGSPVPEGTSTLRRLAFAIGAIGAGVLRKRRKQAAQGQRLHGLASRLCVLRRTRGFRGCRRPTFSRWMDGNVSSSRKECGLSRRG